MENEKNSGQSLLIELLGSVFVEINELIKAGRKTQAAKLAEAFKNLPAFINGTLVMTAETYCAEFVSKYDGEYETFYVNKIISSAYNSPDRLKRLDDFLKNRNGFSRAVNSVLNV